MSDMENKKKYNCLELSLHKINKKKIRMTRNDIKHRRKLMCYIVKEILKKIKKETVVLDGCEVFFGGSFFCGTKIKKPDEFDVDILITLPSGATPILETNKPGYVSIYLDKFNEIEHKEFAQFLDYSNYIQPSNVLNWFKGKVAKALNNLHGCAASSYKMAGGIVKLSDSGPAVTIKFEKGVNSFSLDLVPCIKLSVTEWKKLYPRQIVEQIHYANEFFSVPKAPKETHDGSRFWRISFQKQENAFIHDNYRLKPVLRLLKMLRDAQGHVSIKSYFLKTVIMKMLADDINYPKRFWKCSLSYVFMECLRFYSLSLENRYIPFLWMKKKNLLDDVNPVELINISNRIAYIFRQIERGIDSNKAMAGRILESYFNEYQPAI